MFIAEHVNNEEEAKKLLANYCRTLSNEDVLQ